MNVSILLILIFAVLAAGGLVAVIFYPPARLRVRPLVGAVRSVRPARLAAPLTRATRGLVAPPRQYKAGMHAAHYIVRGGQIEVIPATLGMEQVPGLVTVLRDHAVSLEDGVGSFKGFITGPARQELPSGIVPRIVVITRPRYKRLTVRDMLTKEGLRVERVDLGLLYKIDSEEREGEGFPAARPRADCLYRAAYTVPFWEESQDQARAVDSWEVAVQETAKNVIRQEISRRLLENIFDPKEPGFVYDSIENVATANLQNIVSEWGVEIRRVQIDAIWMAEEHRRALAQEWDMLKQTEAEAERIRVLEGAKRDAWRRMALDIRQALSQDEPSQQVALRLIEFLKYLDSMVEIARAGGAAPAMSNLSQVEKLMIGSGQDLPVEKGSPMPDQVASLPPPALEHPALVSSSNSPRVT